MSRKLFSIFLALCMVLSLSGCGMISLTSDEEEKISMYSASIIRKYNREEDQAIAFYGSKSQATYSAMNSSGAASTDAADDTSADSSGSSETTASVDSVDASVQPEESAVPEETKSISDIIGIEGLNFSLSDVSAIDNYTIEGLMDLSPKDGNRFMEFDFTCTNSTSNDIKVDFSALNITYTCTFGGTTMYSSDTLAPDSLSTFTGTIKAGSSQKLVLLFEFSSDVLSGDLNGYVIKAKSDSGAFNVSI